MGCVGQDGPATPGLDVALHAAPRNVPYGEYQRSGWNYARFHSLHLRSMALASTAVLRPWLAIKSFCAKIWDCCPKGPTDYYQETIIHAALTGADGFYYFSVWDTLVTGVRPVMSDHQTLSETLYELDSIIGCQHRTWVRDVNVQRWRDSFLLSGATVGPTVDSVTTAWRFTPNNSVTALQIAIRIWLQYAI